MIYVECPDTYFDPTKPSLFMAGGIVGCPDWQAELLERIKGLDMVAYNPRRKVFPIHNPLAAKEQITWEFEYLKRASFVSFWFPKETVCPIALYELGRMNSMDRPIIIGIHPEYPRRQDVEIQTGLARPEVPIVYSLEELADDIHCAWAIEKSIDPVPQDDAEEPKEWFKTETLCELCQKKLMGCPFQYESEQCYESRRHFTAR